ncbi:hypothetical protein K3495_g10294 [Podosphaera aphanis]|nr:hypothetical protein K3495_g10294 [Podosphaera aphanis]
MSKITAKNLSYDTTLPPFLARLHANQTSINGRYGCQDSRQKKIRTAEEEAEDEPVYFNEKTADTMTKKEWESKEIEGANGETVVAKTNNKNENEDVNTILIACNDKDRLTCFGTGRKRRVGKLVCTEDIRDENLDQNQPQPQYSINKNMGINSGKANAKSSEISKGIKKRKKIKLSFDD